MALSFFVSALFSALQRGTASPACVHPSLMGYVQAHGRNAVAWEDTFKMDVWYTRNISFKTDWEIYWDTVRIVFKREKICSVTSAIREELKDTNCIKEL